MAVPELVWIAPFAAAAMQIYNYGSGEGGGVDEATAALNGHFYCGLESSSATVQRVAYPNVHNLQFCYSMRPLATIKIIVETTS